MRHILLATAALVALSAPARAQWAVIDVAANTALAEAAIADAKDYALQVEARTQAAKDYVMQDLHLGQMIDQLRTAQTIWREANALTNISSVSGALGYVQTRVPLPGAANEVVGLIQGLSYGGSLSGYVTGFLGSNRVYSPPGDDFQARRIRANSMSNAGSMAIAQEVYTASATRLTGQDDLQARLASARTQAEKQDLIARATIENGRAQAQANQIAAASMLAQARRDADMQVLEQERRQSADMMVEEAETIIRNGGRRSGSSRLMAGP